MIYRSGQMIEQSGRMIYRSSRMIYRSGQMIEPSDQMIYQSGQMIYRSCGVIYQPTPVRVHRTLSKVHAPVNSSSVSRTNLRHHRGESHLMQKLGVTASPVTLRPGNRKPWQIVVWFAIRILQPSCGVLNLCMGRSYSTTRGLPVVIVILSIEVLQLHYCLWRTRRSRMRWWDFH